LSEDVIAKLEKFESVMQDFEAVESGMVEGTRFGLVNLRESLLECGTALSYWAFGWCAKTGSSQMLELATALDAQLETAAQGITAFLATPVSTVTPGQASTLMRELRLPIIRQILKGCRDIVLQRLG